MELRCCVGRPLACSDFPENQERSRQQKVELFQMLRLRACVHKR
jgi:hypothetical protein